MPKKPQSQIVSVHFTQAKAQETERSLQMALTLAENAGLTLRHPTAKLPSGKVIPIPSWAKGARVRRAFPFAVVELTENVGH